MVLNSYITGTVKGSHIGHAIVLRIVIATTNNIVPLIIEALKLRCCAVGITEAIPIIPFTHATSSKLEVAAGELSTLVILLSRYTHVTLSSQLEVLEIGHLKRELNILLRQHLCTFSTEVVEAEVCGGVHAIFAIITTAQREAELAHLAQTREVHITPVVDDICLAGIAQVGQIILLRTFHSTLGIIARDGQLEPVTLTKLLGEAVATRQRVVGISRVGDIETRNSDAVVVLNSHIARTIEGCSVGYAIVLRAIIATTYDILPLVVERSVGVAGLIGIAEPIPIVPVVHATSSKLEVTAGKLCAIIIILCRYTHVTLSSQFKVLEVGHLKRELYVLLRQHFCALCAEIIEAEVCRSVHAIVASIGA